jgi:hypothetical protein
MNQLKQGNLDVDLVQIPLKLPLVLDTVVYQLYNIHLELAWQDLRGLYFAVRSLDPVSEILPSEGNVQGEQVIGVVEA